MPSVAKTARRSGQRPRHLFLLRLQRSSAGKSVFVCGSNVSRGRSPHLLCFASENNSRQFARFVSKILAALRLRVFALKIKVFSESPDTAGGTICSRSRFRVNLISLLRKLAGLFLHPLFQRLFLGDALPIDLRYRAHTNKVLGSFDIRRHTLTGRKGRAQTV
jgi:hypothetical protein